MKRSPKDWLDNTGQWSAQAQLVLPGSVFQSTLFLLFFVHLFIFVPLSLRLSMHVMVRRGIMTNSYKKKSSKQMANIIYCQNITFPISYTSVKLIQKLVNSGPRRAIKQGDIEVKGKVTNRLSHPLVQSAVSLRERRRLFLLCCLLSHPCSKEGTLVESTQPMMTKTFLSGAWREWGRMRHKERCPLFTVHQRTTGRCQGRCCVQYQTHTSQDEDGNATQGKKQQRVASWKTSQGYSLSDVLKAFGNYLKMYTSVLELEGKKKNIYIHTDFLKVTHCQKHCLYVTDDSIAMGSSTWTWKTAPLSRIMKHSMLAIMPV